VKKKRETKDAERQQTLTTNPLIAAVQQQVARWVKEWEKASPQIDPGSYPIAAGRDELRRNNTEEPSAAAGAVDIVDTDYSEARLKAEWAAMLGLNEDNGLSRKIKDGSLRVLPGTKKTAKKVRIHIDDLPKELKGSYQRNQTAEELKRTAKGQ